MQALTGSLRIACDSLQSLRPANKLQRANSEPQEETRSALSESGGTTSGIVRLPAPSRVLQSWQCGYDRIYNGAMFEVVQPAQRVCQRQMVKLNPSRQIQNGRNSKFLFRNCSEPIHPASVRPDSLSNAGAPCIRQPTHLLPSYTPDDSRQHCTRLQCCIGPAFRVTDLGSGKVKTFSSNLPRICYQ